MTLQVCFRHSATQLRMSHKRAPAFLVLIIRVARRLVIPTGRIATAAIIISLRSICDQGIVVRASRIDQQHSATRPVIAEEVRDAVEATTIVALLVHSYIHSENLGTSSHLDGPAPEAAASKPRAVVVHGELRIPIDPRPQRCPTYLKVLLLRNKLANPLPDGVAVLLVTEGAQAICNRVEKACPITWHSDHARAFTWNRTRCDTLAGLEVSLPRPGSARKKVPRILVTVAWPSEVRTSGGVVSTIAFVAGD